MGEGEKTGESIDILKEKITIPAAAEIIKDNFPQNRDLTIFDYGAGDSSSLLCLLENLRKEDYNFKEIICCDLKEDCISESLRNILKTGKILNSSTNVTLIQNYSGSWERMNIIGNKSVDVILAQHSFHQIEDEVELQAMILRANRFLKEDGVFIVTDFNPEYIRWLRANEKGKLSNIDEARRKEKRFYSFDKNMYNFDSGGSNIFINRRLDTVVAMFLSAGFSPSKIQFLEVDTLRYKKDRYKKLSNDRTPMFVTLAFKRNERILRSYDEGSVSSIKRDQNRLILSLCEELDLNIPLFLGSDRIKKGDEIILSETGLDYKGEKGNSLMIVVSPRGRRKGSWMKVLQTDLQE